MKKIVLLTNIPGPYRERLHEIVNKHFCNNYHVIYCNYIEPNRKWKFELGNYNKTFLNSKTIRYKDSYIHLNLSVLKILNSINPEVIITNGFGPIMLLAFVWSKIKRKKHIAFTDGTVKSEKNLSFIHKILRKIVYSYTDAFIGASRQSLDLYTMYKISESKLFRSVLCVDNNYYQRAITNEKKYDILFSGQFIERKMPFFFIKVAKIITERLGYCKVLLIGSGPLEKQMLELLEKYKINYTYPGFIQSKELPQYYASSKILLFPTRMDPWGIVANEACAVGVPVITTENAGVANELIINGFNGYILPLDEEIWAEHVIQLLTNKELYKTFSNNALKSVQEYNYENASDGVIKAIEYALNKKYV